jgi:hypothetical protein
LSLPDKYAGKFILGAGPVGLLPTATNDALGQDQWALGPDAFVVLSDPRLKGSDLVYHVDILEGKIPATAGLSTLFIDSAVRRVARRTRRRTARRVERRHD